MSPGLEKARLAYAELLISKAKSHSYYETDNLLNRIERHLERWSQDQPLRLARRYASRQVLR